MVSIKRPVLFKKRPGQNFPQRVSIKLPGLSQVLGPSEHENKGNLDSKKSLLKDQYYYLNLKF